MKKIIFFKYLITTLIMSISISSYAAIFVTPKPPEVNAKSFILIDYNSGKIIASKDVEAKRAPASLTKLMTSYVTFKRLSNNFVSLDDKVLISEKAWKTGGSRSFLQVGTKVGLETLLKGMIIQSGNDASVAIAEHIAGSEGTFVALMNQYAKTLGMRNTNFENASGLYHPQQLTTSYDISLLAQAIIKEFPEYYKWYSEKYFTYNNIKQPNRNNLLRTDKTVDGLKTGYTSEAGYCLVSSAKRVNMRLISVVLGAPSVKDRERNTRDLLDYGFRFFETQQINIKPQNTIIYKGDKNNISIGLEKPFALTLERGKFNFLNKKIKINQEIIAPIDKGVKVGELQVIFQNNDTGEEQVVATKDIVSLEEINSGGFLGDIIDSIKLWF